ncbi:MAG TPA: N-acetylmuramoyl-L-alanine amidase, partial [Vicinamibacteria bacterium]|nr:N-acetylmuramoyl-L-alanine amidase [Vicinamibacteria bacterium]
EPSPPAAARPAAARPDAALYREAQRAEATLRATRARQRRPPEWEKVVLAYRRVVARYPRSGYCDNALLAVGNLYREMATRFRNPRYEADAVAAFKALVSEYPSSRLGEEALWNAVEMAQASRDRRRLGEAGRAYLDAFPDAPRARQVKALLRRKTPAAPLPNPPPPGLVSVFDVRSWSGESSTRVVLDLQRKVKLKYDRIADPDRLFVDLLGTRLHPNLWNRSFPVGDGLLEQIRIAQNREDVVRVVLDFKDVKDHGVFFLEDPARLVIDVRGAGSPPAAASAGASPPPGPPGAVDTLPSRRLDGLAPPAARPEEARPAGPLLVGSAGGTTASAAGTPRRRSAPPPPEPPALNRAGSYSLARQLGLGARRIVIDAGHGGHDPGTIGPRGLQEKDLVLDVALRLERLVRAELGAEVVLTRTTDVYVPLEERTAIANSRGADLFLSIHANASRNPEARGIETYFLSFAQNAHAEAVAARENAISAATLKDLQQLVKAITLNSKIDESRDFASSVQEAMVKNLREHHAVQDRGVHTAPFYVLIGANMPSVLAEIAFVSNPGEEKRLKTGEYRDLVARALLRGVQGYLEALNRTQMRQLTGAGARSTVTDRGSGR